MSAERIKRLLNCGRQHVMLQRGRAQLSAERPRLQRRHWLSSLLQRGRAQLSAERQREQFSAALRERSFNGAALN